MSEEFSSPPPRQYRSEASNNWRAKDDTPRVDQSQSQSQQPRMRSNFNRTNNGSYSNNNTNSSTSADASATPGTRLYVGNLLYTIQKGDVEALFAEHGFNVVGVTISTDPFTGRNPSYCFVDVDSPEEAQRAIAELSGVDLRGRALRVSPGVARRGQGQSDSNGNGNGGREARVKNYDQGWGRESKEERSKFDFGFLPTNPGPILFVSRESSGDYKPTFDRWNRTDASSHWQAPQTEGRRLFVGGLPRIEPQSALDEEIQVLFATHLPDSNTKPTAVSKLISPHPSKVVGGEPGNHYYCFVDLERAEDVDVVIEKLAGAQGSWGGAVRVGRAREQRERGPDRKVVREQGLRNDGERKPFETGSWRRD
ncbi:hypothetical protein ABEF92_000918 [Exophiala dermatitidis]